MKSQNATATIGNISTCAGEDVLVPVDVVDFYDIGAMTFYIGYDTNTASFITLQNINPAVPGNLSFNEVGGQINIAYSNTNPFDLSGETLFDLKFNFFGDSCIISFNPGTEIANSNLEVIPLDTIPGSIANSIQIVDQPNSIQAYPDNDVIFRVTTLDQNNYQWQENTGSGWTNLQNNQTYSGVTNDTLTVHDVTLNFNGYTYRCVITEESCTLVSDTALLEVALAYPVATLGQISSCPENQILEPLFVGDFFDVVEFTFNIAFEEPSLGFIELLNIHPDLIPGNLSVSPLSPSGISIHWNHTSPVSITSGKLFDIALNYTSGDQILTFENGTEVLNSFNNPINITLNNGTVNQYELPLIIEQPLDDTVTEPQQAMFTIEASLTSTYQWHVSQDAGSTWLPLDNSGPYFNVTTDTLTINPAVYEMNGYRYACMLGNEHCTLLSGSGLLVVDTLTLISADDEFADFNIYPNPVKNKLSVTLPLNFDLQMINVYHLNGILIDSYQLNATKPGREIALDLTNLPSGLLLLKISAYSEGKQTVINRKIMKVN